jgi:hypothetical protein
LKEYLVPLQAKLDIVLDSDESFNYMITKSNEHMCEGPIIPTRKWATTVIRECNKLCYLTPEAREVVLTIEGEISEVIARMNQLVRDVETLEKDGQVVKETGSSKTNYARAKPPVYAPPPCQESDNGLAQ